jgi:hypothetical protein
MSPADPAAGGASVGSAGTGIGTVVRTEPRYACVYAPNYFTLVSPRGRQTLTGLVL